MDTPHKYSDQSYHLLSFIMKLGIMAMVAITLIAYVKNTIVPSKDTVSSTFSTSEVTANTKAAATSYKTTIDKIFVDKSERSMQLLSGDNVVKTYHIALGESPIGHKRQQGDERTPTGIYTLDYKNENSIAHRSIHISYPNATDKAYAKALGVSPGSNIMIHGQMNGFGKLAWLNQQRDWTDGCIAVTNDEMNEIMDAVELGIAIEIVE